MVYFSSLIFFVIEQKVNPEVKDYNDALWWAFMDVTTVGSNIIAITPTGRIFVGPAGRSRHDDVPDLHGLCHEPSTIGKQEKRKLL